MLIWGLWDFRKASRIIPALTNLPILAPDPTQAPFIPEQRNIVLEWPPIIRIGDSDVIHISLEMSMDGKLTPTTYVAGQEIQGKTAHIPNLYETHNVLAEAFLDIGGFQVAPANDIIETLRPGKAVRFYWSIRPRSLGTFRGTVWLHLNFIPIKGGTESRLPLTAQMIEIRSVNFLGLGGMSARFLGSVGTLAGSVLGLDNFISKLWKLVRQKPRNSG
jgi:hypothetical protein